MNRIETVRRQAVVIAVFAACGNDRDAGGEGTERIAKLDAVDGFRHVDLLFVDRQLLTSSGISRRTVRLYIVRIAQQAESAATGVDEFLQLRRYLLQVVQCLPLSWWNKTPP